ncbi:MAG: Gldg family protein [Verrucomicrobia bacterium]|nr:Gldg family protein [Verrucomicrobiota bacterium]MBU1733723.1 Gldg family protein [Verrucomicrobiota bacterium]MBU1855903.1 Gldg family protein [Verrucomicrobiota bacterium]
MKARQIWKFTGSLVGLLALLAILIAVNILLSRVRARVDLTEEKLYTLSEGTRTVLKSLDEPVTLKFFFSGGASEVPMPLKNFARQVEDLLKEYELASGGKILVETYNPKPDSDAEEWAQRYGLVGEQMGITDSVLYLGLVAVKGDANTVLPFLDPRNEEMLEYNITRMITRVANPKKPVVGILSSLPVMGVRTFPYAMPGQPRPKNQPPWVAFQDLNKDYDVRQLPVEADAIDPAIDVLIVVHPKAISEKTQYAIDQFVLRGGRLLAFIDPLCLADAMNQEAAMGMGMARPISDLGRLTAAWGITYEPDKVVADLSASTRVQRGDNTIEDNPVFLSLRKFNIDGKDMITSSLESLGLPIAGAFAGTGKEGLSVGSLLVSSDQSALISAMAVQMGTEAIRSEFKSGGKRLNLAIRLQGKFKTAFPQGKPKAAPDTEKKNPAASEKEPVKLEDTTPALQESAKPGTVILVADVDMLYDAFAVQELPIFGQRVFQPLNDNVNFFANAVEQLSGSADLGQIRARGRFERPFDRVQELQSEAQQRWMMQERTLQEQLAATQERLESLQSKKDKSQRFILSAEQEQEIAKFKQEQIKTQHELKQVRKNLREGIEELGVKVKAINILAVPILVCLAGLAFGWYRRQSVMH